ncbi:MAG: hypothetical protein IJY56_03110 [Clostridia bacterium]|nr:hypothetical protein [Clostridia bacterium]
MLKWKFVLLYLLGGTGYALMEIVWRGYSHWSMFLLGGVCFLMAGRISHLRTNIFIKSLICGSCITVAEFFCGLVVNRLLGLEVWDYTHLPFDVLGQICLPFTLLWIVLSVAVIPLYSKFDSELSGAQKILNKPDVVKFKAFAVKILEYSGRRAEVE